MTLDGLFAKQDALRARLGPQLADEIEQTEGKYMNRGGILGSIIGPITGALISYYLGDPEMSTAFDIGMGGFLGLHAGVNFGAGFGLVYGKRKTKQLVQKYPDYESEIKEYAELNQALTASRVRCNPL
jgi:hypothetical protein